MSLKDGLHQVHPGKIAAVVTHLEMTSRSTLRQAPLPDGLQFDRLERDPVVYRDVFRRVGQDWLWFGRLSLDDLQLCSIIENDQVALWTLRREGKAEALLELDFRNDGQCELAYFGLTKALIGTGAGSFLMDQAISMAWAHSIRKFTVHTCTLDSPQALGFYQKSGFQAVRREIEIADDPRSLGLYPDTMGPTQPLL